MMILLLASLCSQYIFIIYITPTITTFVITNIIIIVFIL